MPLIGTLIDWIDRMLALPSDDEDERVRKRAVAIVPLGAICTTFGLCAAYLHLGLPLAALVAFSYGFSFCLGFVHFLRTKKAEPFMYLQLGATLAAVFIGQWVLGGYVVSGGITIFGITAPFAAVYMRARVRTIWFVVYAALAVFSGFIDHWVSLHAAKVPSAWLSLSFVFNSVGLLCFIYVPIRYVMDELVRIKAQVEWERKRSDALLLNILPAVIADRLKSGETVIADRCDEVTILFADIVGFTPLAARLEPHVVVEILNEIFSAFDELADRHGLEKIKTIGDSYMAVAGIPVARADHAEASIEMAVDMLAVIQRYRMARDVPLDIRVGLNSGSVLAGVIGKRKFAYDVYGDTVNTASRMESHGIPGVIQVTEETRRRLRDRYEFDEREPIEVKGKGLMKTYLLVGTRTQSVIS